MAKTLDPTIPAPQAAAPDANSAPVQSPVSDEVMAEQMARVIRENPEVRRAVLSVAQDEGLSGLHPAGRPFSEMAQAMEEIVALRKEIALPSDVLDAILDEYRHETGRG